MTRDQIAGKVRENLSDLGITYYSVSDINESIQDAYEEVVVYCECIEKETDIEYRNDTTYYDLSALVPDYYRPLRIFNTSENFQLRFGTDREQDSWNTIWEISSRTARDAVILGPRYIGFNGRAAEATGKFHLNYKAQAPVLSGNSVILINAAYLLLLENYATADLLEQNQEYIKAQIYWNQYDEMIEIYRSKIMLLSKTDRRFARRP